MKISNRLLVKKAKREWINTMKRNYPDFNYKLWGRHNSYRIYHPQGIIN